MHLEKAGVLTRILESDERGEYVPLRLARLGADDVDRFIAARRAEWAQLPRPAKLDEEGKEIRPAQLGRHVKDATIAKELVTLRCALKDGGASWTLSSEPIFFGSSPVGAACGSASLARSCQPGSRRRTSQRSGASLASSSARSSAR
jgi:hypothetical protein